MRRALSALVIATILIPATGALSPASAGGDGRVVAGVAGGFLGGLLLGSALAPRPAPPPPGYYAAAPVYYDAPHCYWAMGAPYWDGYYGVWRQPRVRACD
jgi:hypothetical protein